MVGTRDFAAVAVGGGLDMASILNQTVSGGLGGAALMAAIGFIQKVMA